MSKKQLAYSKLSHTFILPIFLSAVGREYIWHNVSVGLRLEGARDKWEKTIIRYDSNLGSTLVTLLWQLCSSAELLDVFSVKQSYADGIMPQLLLFFFVSRIVVIERGRYWMWDYYSFLWGDLRLRKLLDPWGRDGRHKAYVAVHGDDTIHAQNSCNTLCW